MSVLDLVRVLIYRVHEHGLEVFLINNEMDTDPDVWRIPEGSNQHLLHEGDRKTIELDPVCDECGKNHRTVAIEGDWHDIPSIRGMLKHDIKLAKKILKDRLPGSEKGTYFLAKECFKKVLPHEYAAIKELKDILADRNALKNI